LSHTIKKILLNNLVIHQPLTKIILNKLSHIEPIYFDAKNIQTTLAEHDAITTLLLTNLRGKPIIFCPATTKYHCCNYRILNVGHNCNINCTYCILQDYLKIKSLSIFTDITDYLQKDIIDEFLPPNKRYRLGTGEFTDSLFLDNLSELSILLINFFRNYPNIILELKTKSINTNNLFKVAPASNIIISWSLNSININLENESLAPNSLERIEIAKQISEYGYDLGFHFDPIILYENYLSEYQEIIKHIYTKIKSDKIRWISLGALRFTKKLKNSFFQRNSKYIDEFILSDDQKYRYLRFRREVAYREILKEIRKYNPSQFTYLCMESPTVWKNVYGFHFVNNEEFENWFNKNVFKENKQ
jgi:spore photoproduct lyase